MNGNDIVVHLACALAEERARHEQTRAALAEEKRANAASASAAELTLSDMSKQIIDLRAEIDQKADRVRAELLDNLYDLAHGMGSATEQLTAVRRAIVSMSRDD